MNLLTDIRYVVRSLSRVPLFAAVAVVSLSLGVGANTVIFTLFKSVLLDRLAVPHPEDLKLLSAEFSSFQDIPVQSMWGGWDASDGGKPRTPYLSYPLYQQLRDKNRTHPVIGDLFAFKSVGNPIDANADGATFPVTLELVSGNFYEQLGIAPQVGRTITASDDAPGAPPVGIISVDLWERMFGRAPDILGKVIKIGKTPITIIGVNPARFTGAASVQVSPDLFVPLSTQPKIITKADGINASSLLDDGETWWISVMGRKIPQISDRTAYTTLALWLDQSARATMNLGENNAPALVLGSGSQGVNYMNGVYYRPVYVIFLLSGTVYLLTCLNIINLLRTRCVSRRQEFAVRFALGAATGRVVRLILLEGLLLSVVAGCVGLGLGYGLRDVIPRMLSSLWEVAPLTTRFDFKTLAFVVITVLASGLVLGLLPVLDAITFKVDDELKHVRGFIRGRRKGISTTIMMTAQIALSTVLLIGAGLFGRTLLNLSRTSLGFDPHQLVLFEIAIPDARYPAPANIAIYARLEERLAEISGVRFVAASSEPVLGNQMTNVDFSPVDIVADAPRSPISWVNSVGKDFFRTYGIPILAGRGFAASDIKGPRVAVINRANALLFFKNASPIGRRFRSDSEEYVIVGVCADAKYSSVRRAIPPTFYRFYQQSRDEPKMTFALKSSRSLRSIQNELKAAVGSVDASLAVRNLRTEVQQIDQTLTMERLLALITASFGMLSIILAGIGVYAVVALDASLRRSEFGIRMALGASPARIFAMLVRESGLVGACGVVIGIAASYAVTRLVGAMLYGVAPNDTLSRIISGGLLIAISVSAGCIAAYSASSVDAAQAMRHE
jgi:predicted permease